MRFRKNDEAGWTNLRQRLQDYSDLKERRAESPATAARKIDKSKPGSVFHYFPLNIFQRQHSHLFFKTVLVVFTILLMLFFSVVNLPFSDMFLERVHYITTWQMDFRQAGEQVLPVVKNLWEGEIERGFQEVIAPESTLEEEGNNSDFPVLFPPLRNASIETGFGFGFNPLSEREEINYGVIFSAPVGSEVYASAAGKVVATGRHWYYGDYLILQHAAGLETCYGNLEEIYLEKGDPVQQGQPIGMSRRVQEVERSFLLFEVRQNGIPLDPLEAGEI